MRNAFGGLNRLDMAEERMSLKMSTETFKTKKQRKKKIYEPRDKRYNIYTHGGNTRRKRKRKKNGRNVKQYWPRIFQN